MRFSADVARIGNKNFLYVGQIYWLPVFRCAVMGRKMAIFHMQFIE